MVDRLPLSRALTEGNQTCGSDPTPVSDDFTLCELDEDLDDVDFFFFPLFFSKFPDFGHLPLRHIHSRDSTSFLLHDYFLLI